MTARASVAAAVVLALVACGGDDAEQDKKPPRTPAAPVIIRVAGEVKLHPLERTWRTDAGLPLPELEGLQVHVEDALKATAGQPALKSTTSGAAGAFETTDVDVSSVKLALVASVADPKGIIADCGYGLVRGKPEGDLLDMPVYVVTKEFLQALIAPTERTVEELLALGFIFAQVTDATHERPVAQAELALVVQSQPRAIEHSETNPLWYLDEKLETAANEGGTSPSGVVLYVPEFGAKEYTAIKPGASFDVKLAGSRRNFVLSAFITEQ